MVAGAHLVKDGVGVKARAREDWITPAARKRQQLGKQKKELPGEIKSLQKAQHRAFPRGPPPQYYPGSNLLNFAVRMGSGEPG